MQRPEGSLFKQSFSIGIQLQNKRTGTMTDFDRHEDHIAGGYPEPDKNDLSKDKKIKLIVLAGLGLAIILAMLDDAGVFGYWGG